MSIHFRHALTKVPRRAHLGLAGLSLLAITACAPGHPSLDDPSLSTRDLKLEEFFDGNLTAYGQFQDIFGEVRRQFTVKIKGDWNGETLTLVEDFTYEDGSLEQRVWTLRKTGPDTWEGTAPGVIGVATGTVKGDRFNWKYTIDLPVTAAGQPTTTTRVTFDDWIWLLDDKHAYNRAYMAKYGVDVGDVSIFFIKK